MLKDIIDGEINATKLKLEESLDSTLATQMKMMISKFMTKMMERLLKLNSLL